MKTRSRGTPGWPALAALAAASALVAGCGGSSHLEGSSPAQPAPAAAENDLPTEALASIEGLVQWARALAMRDDSEPLRVQGAPLPTSETAQPLPLDDGA